MSLFFFMALRAECKRQHNYAICQVMQINRLSAWRCEDETVLAASLRENIPQSLRDRNRCNALGRLWLGQVRSPHGSTHAENFSVIVLPPSCSRFSWSKPAEVHKRNGFFCDTR